MAESPDDLLTEIEASLKTARAITTQGRPDIGRAIGESLLDIAKEQTAPSALQYLGGRVGARWGLPGALLGTGVGAGAGSLLTNLLRRGEPQLNKALFDALLSMGFAAGPAGVRGTTGSIRTTRPIHVSRTGEALEAFQTPESLAAKQWYATAAGKPVRSYVLGRKMPYKTFKELGEEGLGTFDKPEVVDFEVAHGMVQRLKREANVPRIRGTEEGQEKLARAKALEAEIEASIPGYLATQKGYHRMSSIERVQELLSSDDPVAAFRKMRGEGASLRAKRLRSQPTISAFRRDPESLDEIERILGKLGKVPKAHWWDLYHMARAAGTGATALLGGAGPYGGLAAGAGAIAIPEMTNAVVAKAIHTKAGRRLLEYMIDKGLPGRPEDWAFLGRVASEAMRQEGWTPTGWR